MGDRLGIPGAVGFLLLRHILFHDTNWDQRNVFLISSMNSFPAKFLFPSVRQPAGAPVRRATKYKWSNFKEYYIFEQ